MSARLNLNTIRYTSWKGKPFYQITGQLHQNQIDASYSTLRPLFLPPPVKLYRREVVYTETTSGNQCVARNATSIDQLNMPNGYLVTQSTENQVGLVDVLENPRSTNTYENGECLNEYACIEKNARRRVRSSGMVRRAYSASKNSDPVYFTNTNQYLVNRNRTFAQNQYNHVRLGSASLVSSYSQYKTNVYSPNGLSHCAKTYIQTDVNDTFYYLWTTFSYDNITSVETTPDNESIGSYLVTIPEGYYDVDGLNAAFQTVMTTNKHYYVNRKTGSFVFLLHIIYNTVEGRIELQSYSNSTVADSSSNSLSSSAYTVPTSGTEVSEPYTIPAFYFPSGSGMGSVLGFTTGFYPNIVSLGTNESESSTGTLSNTDHSIYPSYVMKYYKPNNSRFATQGAVSSSDHITRVNYDTITRNGLSFQTAFGREVANALAYGVPGNAYTLKDKYGYPNKRTPRFNPATGELTDCKSCAK